MSQVFKFSDPQESLCDVCGYQCISKQKFAYETCLRPCSGMFVYWSNNNEAPKHFENRSEMYESYNDYKVGRAAKIDYPTAIKGIVLLIIKIHIYLYQIFNSKQN